MADNLDINTKTATIANSNTTSDVVSCSKGLTLVGIYMPAALTGANFSFTACDTANGTYVPVYDTEGAAQYSIAFGASRYIPVDPAVFAGVRFLKIVSDATEGGSRSIKLACRVV